MTNYTVIDNNLIVDTTLPDGAYRIYNLMFMSLVLIYNSFLVSTF